MQSRLIKMIYQMKKEGLYILIQVIKTISKWVQKQNKVQSIVRNTQLMKTIIE